MLRGFKLSEVPGESPRKLTGTLFKHFSSDRNIDCRKIQPLKKQYNSRVGHRDKDRFRSEMTF